MNEYILLIFIVLTLSLSFFGFVRPKQTILMIFALSMFTGPIKMLLDIPESPLILDISLLSILLSLFVYNHILNNKKLVLPPLSMPVLFLLVVSVIQMMNPTIPSITAALEGFRFSSFYMLAFFMATYTFTDKRDCLRLMKIIVVCSLVVSLYGIRQHYFPFEAEIEWAMRQHVHHFWGVDDDGSLVLKIFSTFNGLGAHWLFIPLSVLTHVSLFFILNKRLFKLFVFFSLILFLVSTLFSMGRAAWVSSFIGILVITVLMRGKKLQTVGLLLSLLLSAFLFTKALPQTDVLQERFGTFLNLEEDRGFMNRFSLMELGGGWILENYWGRGVGTTTSGLISKYNVGDVAAHNQFLNTGIELGVVPMLVYIYFVVSSLIIGYKVATKSFDREVRLIALWIFAYNLAYQLFSLEGSVTGFPQSFHYWILMGILANFYRSYLLEQKSRRVEGMPEKKQPMKETPLGAKSLVQNN